MMTAALLNDFVLHDEPATARKGFLSRTLDAIIAAQTAKAEAYVGIYLAQTNPVLAEELGYDVEALRIKSLPAVFHL